jgi:hypothetical protein
MKRKTIAALVVLFVMLTVLVGTVAAQSEGDPTATPTVAPTISETPVVTETATEVPTEIPTIVPTVDPTQPVVTPLAKPGAKFFTHPVVKLLSAYFDQQDEVVDPNQPVDPSVTPSPEPTGTVDETGSGLGPIGEKIAAYHEEGMGFGVLVKIFSMVKTSEEACAAVTPVEDPTADAVTPECTPLTAEELVGAVQGGTGMGQLFKEYGKPAMMGVGHVRQALKHQEQEPPQVEPTAEAPAAQTLDTTPGKNLKDKTNKGKPDKGKGPHK